MKIVDKVFYWIISVIMFVISVVCIFGLLNIFGLGEKIFELPLAIYKKVDFNTGLIMLVSSLVLMLMSIKGIFFQSKENKEKNTGILLENNNGKLSISKETIQNLIKDVSSEIEGIEVSKSESSINKAGSLAVRIDIVILKEVNIKETTKEIQEKVKHAIKNMTDIEASEININVKNISNKKLPKKKTKNVKEVKEEQKNKDENLNNETNE